MFGVKGWAKLVLSEGLVPIESIGSMGLVCMVYSYIFDCGINIDKYTRHGFLGLFFSRFLKSIHIQAAATKPSVYSSDLKLSRCDLVSQDQLSA